MDNVSRDKNAKKESKEMLEIRNNITEMSAFDGFISRLAMLIIFTAVNYTSVRISSYFKSVTWNHTICNITGKKR